MSDFLLLAGIALGVLSVVLAVVQLMQTRPPRAAAITLVLAIAAILAGGLLAPQPFRLSHICDAWTRLIGGHVMPAADPASQVTPNEPVIADDPARAEDGVSQDNDATEGAPADEVPANSGAAEDAAPAEAVPPADPSDT